MTDNDPGRKRPPIKSFAELGDTAGYQASHTDLTARFKDADTPLLVDFLGLAYDKTGLSKGRNRDVALKESARMSRRDAVLQALLTPIEDRESDGVYLYTTVPQEGEDLDGSRIAQYKVMAFFQHNGKWVFLEQSRADLAEEIPGQIASDKMLGEVDNLTASGKVNSWIENPHDEYNRRLAEIESIGKIAAAQHAKALPDQEYTFDQLEDMKLKRINYALGFVKALGLPGLYRLRQQGKHLIAHFSTIKDINTVMIFQGKTNIPRLVAEDEEHQPRMHRARLESYARGENIPEGSDRQDVAIEILSKIKADLARIDRR